VRLVACARGELVESVSGTISFTSWRATRLSEAPGPPEAFLRGTSDVRKIRGGREPVRVCDFVARRRGTPG
jgi:hypothetical protein